MGSKPTGELVFQKGEREEGRVMEGLRGQKKRDRGLGLGGECVAGGGKTET